MKSILSYLGNKMFIVNPYRYGAGFDPTSVAGLELWYDSSDLSTLWTDNHSTNVTAAGQTVYWWDDKSGNGGHSVQVTEADRPTYQTSGISFDGGDYLQNGFYVPAHYPVSMFVVAQKTSSSGGTPFCIVASGSATDYVRIAYRGTLVYAMNVRDGSSDTFANTSSTYNDGSKHVITGIVASATDKSVWVDGADNGTNTTSATPATSNITCIGRLDDLSPSSGWDDYIQEILVYNSALGTTDRQYIEDGLKAKHGIA